MIVHAPECICLDCCQKIAAPVSAQAARDNAEKVRKALEWNGYTKMCREGLAALDALLADLAAANQALAAARLAFTAIMNELGVPGTGYPQPVANAYEIARAALAAVGQQEGGEDG